MEKIFAGIYGYFQKRKWQLYLLFFVCLIASAFFAVQLKFEEDISKILPKDDKVEKLNHVFQHSKFMDKLVVMVSLKDTAVAGPDSLVAFADDFVTQLQQKLSSYISRISYKVDDEVTMAMFDVINEHLPIYLTEQDYLIIDSLITPNVIGQTLQRNIQTLTSPAGIAFKNMISITATPV